MKLFFNSGLIIDDLNVEGKVPVVMERFTIERLVGNIALKISLVPWQEHDHATRHASRALTDAHGLPDASGDWRSRFDWRAVTDARRDGLETRNGTRQGI